MLGSWIASISGLCEQYCHEHRGAYILSNQCFGSPQPYTQNWNCQVISSPIFNFLRKLHAVFHWLHRSAFPPPVPKVPFWARISTLLHLLALPSLKLSSVSGSHLPPFLPPRKRVSLPSSPFASQVPESASRAGLFGWQSPGHMPFLELQGKLAQHKYSFCSHIEEGNRALSDLDS